MQIKILGSAAGGGFPQWNCACANCAGLRAGTLRASARTQTQLAFTPDGELWFLIGASPDLRTQLINAPELAPQQGQTRSPIAGVFLPSADIDSVLGLMHLREFQSFFVFATAGVQRVLKAENRIFKVLERADPPVQWQTLAAKGRLGCHLGDSPGDQPSFICNTIALGGHYPDYVSDESRRAAPAEDASIGFLFERGGKKIFVAPGLSGRTGEWAKVAASADLILIDGTFWDDDELRRTGRSDNTARDLGHLPLSGPEGLLAQFPRDAHGRKILIHVNNTNPILDEDSEEYHFTREAGFEIARDGITIDL